MIPQVSRRCCVALGLAVLGFPGGCGAPAEQAPDAAADLPAVEAPVAFDAGPMGLAVDFSVAGCPSFDPVLPACTGSAPLTVSFVPIASPSIGTFQWDFGDGTARSFVMAPSHTFTLPGTYDVTLTVAAASDSASRVRTSFITVVPSKTGALCDVDAQCDEGHSCLCAPGTPGCPPAFARGLCTSACSGTDACGADAPCVDLARSAGGDAMAAADPWRKALCLRSCTTDADCAPGLRCRQLPSVAETATPWVAACFLGFPTEVGGSCRGPSGALEGPTCATGTCLDVGALGLCSLDCSWATCPAGTACARLGDGRSLCLKACGGGGGGSSSSASDCTSDPLLACEGPGAPGALGFSLVPAMPGAAATYCAPRGCTSDMDCGPAGVCRPASGGNHCARRA